jgi:hypothetical protein
MENNEKHELHDGNSQLVENWIFSLIPVGVAFVFYLVFILQSDLDNKGTFLIYGAAAAFIGLESYWITQGVRLGRKRIVIIGLIGIALTLGLLALIL